MATIFHSPKLKHPSRIPWGLVPSAGTPEISRRSFFFEETRSAFGQSPLGFFKAFFTVEMRYTTENGAKYFGYNDVCWHHH